MKAAKGLLLLVNDGNYSLESDTILDLVGQIMNGSGTSIDSVVYFTINMVAAVPIIQRNALVWLSPKHIRREGVDPKFLTWLQESWMKFFEDFAGVPIPKFVFSDPEILSRTKLLRPPEPGSYDVDLRSMKFRCQKVVGDTITWLAMELPLHGIHHQIAYQNLRFIGYCRLITDEAEIKRLTSIYKALPLRPVA